jgi:hypothetical protein
VVCSILECARKLVENSDAPTGSMGAADYQHMVQLELAYCGGEKA